MRSSILNSLGGLIVSLHLASCAHDANFIEHKTVHDPCGVTETHLTVTGKATKADFWQLDAIYIENYKDLVRERGGIDMPHGFYSTSLDKTRAYTYDIYRQCKAAKNSSELSPWDISTEIFQIRLDNRIIYDGSTCQLHHRKMKRYCVKVEVVARSPNFIEAHSKYFPNAMPVYGDRERFVWLCSDCVSAENHWRLQQLPPKKLNKTPLTYRHEPHIFNLNHDALTRRQG